MRLPIKGIKKEQYEKYLELIPDLKREKTQKYITIVLTLITSIVLGLFAINPTFSTIANLQKQIDDNTFVQQKLQQKINNLAVLQQKYTNIQPDLPIVNDAVPATTQIPLFIADVQAVAKNTSLTLTSFQTSEVNLLDSSAGKYSSFDFTLTASGDYQNVTDFLSSITNFQRAVALKDIILSTENGALQLSLKGTVFFKQ
ncbi:MAG TPA: type 4a pilus biogenesis protein PilO [Patescibacteria group bacterium]|jgi:Tfp pilus assembly protein PilO|nr:type 4a pilus biogenesis protein PilO [Patescibacteria group bacterium]